MSWSCKDCSSKEDRKQRASRCRPCWNKWRNQKRRARGVSTYDKKGVLRCRYGLSHDQFLRLIQDDHCEICGRADVELVVDHDHSRGKSVRGAPCRQCNLMLGYAADNPQTLINGARYLMEKEKFWKDNPEAQHAARKLQ